MADLPKIIMVSCGYQHSIVLDDKGRLWGAGDNRCGQLGSEGAQRMNKFTQINTPEEMGRVIKVSCGYDHSVAQSETKELWGTGNNQYGELGIGHNQNVGQSV